MDTPHHSLGRPPGQSFSLYPVALAQKCTSRHQGLDARSGKLHYLRKLALNRKLDEKKKKNTLNSTSGSR